MVNMRNRVIQSAITSFLKNDRDGRRIHFENAADFNPIIASTLASA
jgi:hypothetical protein